MSHPIFENSLWNAGSFSYDERDVILDDTFIKIGKKKSKIRLVAFPSFLIKIKNFSSQSKRMNLSFEVKFEVIKLSVKSSESDSSKISGLKLSMENLNKVFIIEQVETVLIKWKQFLSQKIIQYGFHDNFIVSKKIGSGSFATVYLGQNKENKQNVAIKAINKKTLSEEKFGKMSLINEINIMRQMSHTSIVKLLEVQESKNQYFLILEYLEGGSLAELTQKKKQFSQLEIVEIMFGILNGVNYLHKSNIMHRDLKLENILFRNQQKLSIAIADFGLANEINQNLMFKKCGTPGYVAPEVLHSNNSVFYNEMCDLFSVGAIFYQLLTGKPVFKGENKDAILKMNQVAEIDYSEKHFQSAPYQAMDLLKKLLEKNPNKRISANDALKHPYFKSKNSEQELLIEMEDHCSVEYEKFQNGQLIDQNLNFSKKTFNMSRINKFSIQPLKSEISTAKTFQMNSQSLGKFQKRQIFLEINSALEQNNKKRTQSNQEEDQENQKYQENLQKIRSLTQNNTQYSQDVNQSIFL